MDRSEARAILESMKLIDFRFAPKNKATEAIDLAIEALMLRDKKEQKSKLESEQMREYIPKGEALDIIKSMPMDLVEEYVYELDGIWIDDDEEKLQLSGETSTISEKESVEGVAESATTTDCISRADAIAYIDRITNSGLGKNKSLDYIRKYISALPSAETHEIRTETHGVCSDCISRQQAIEAVANHFMADAMIRSQSASNDIDDWKEVAEGVLSTVLPVTPTEQNEEDILKFYYVESLDEYWIGQRCGTRYYGKWTGNCFTYGYSRYLPWGEHVVAPDTLWKEHTYPSEPKEIPFNEWLQGFLQKERQTERTGEWVSHELWDMPWFTCSECNYHGRSDFKFCPNCGAKMGERREE